MLPLLDGWQWRILDFNIEDNNAPAPVLSPGQEFTLVDEPGPAWAFGAIVTTNNIYARIFIEAEKGFGQGGAKFDTSAYGAIAENNLLPNNFGVWIWRYGKIPLALRKTIATPGTAEQLNSDRAMPQDIDVLISALPGNTGNIYLAGLKLYAQTAVLGLRKTIPPGASVTLKGLQNLNRIWLDADVAGEGVEALHEYPDIIPNDDAVFSLAFAPSIPYPFARHIKVSVINPRVLPRGAGAGPNVTAAKLLQYQFAFVKVTEEEKFRKSVRELIGYSTDDLARLLASTGPAQPPSAMRIPIGARR